MQFPPDVPDVPASAQDLIRQLLCRQEERLGRGGLDDFRNHPFFEGVDWERLATSTAPYVPELRGPLDTSNFDVDDDTLNHPVSGQLLALWEVGGSHGKPREFLEAALALREVTQFTCPQLGCWESSSRGHPMSQNSHTCASVCAHGTWRSRRLQQGVWLGGAGAHGAQQAAWFSSLAPGPWLQLSAAAGTGACSERAPVPGFIPPSQKTRMQCRSQLGTAGEGTCRWRVGSAFPRSKKKKSSA